MTVSTCENCGSRVYNLGCVNCNEVAYIEEQDYMTERDYVRLQNGTIEHRDNVRKDRVTGQWVLR